MNWSVQDDCGSQGAAEGQSAICRGQGDLRPGHGFNPGTLPRVVADKVPGSLMQGGNGEVRSTVAR